MALHSWFEADCKHCGDKFRLGTGSADECNRCATVIAGVRPLSLIEIARLLDAAGNRPRGTFRIVETSSEDSAS